MKGYAMAFSAFDTDPHPCEQEGCDNIVMFDDEPYCFTHSPDEGSYVLGYSYKKTHS
jgi:hypothetical protein